MKWTSKFKTFKAYKTNTIIINKSIQDRNLPRDLSQHQDLNQLQDLGKVTEETLNKEEIILLREGKIMNKINKNNPYLPNFSKHSLKFYFLT